MSLKSSALSVVRRFQSETDSIREAREPLVARITMFALAGLIAILVAISFLAHIDRVVTISQGKIVTKNELLTVFQALDTSLIKSIDVREGDQVKAGQLLATLDQTFANADVSQYKLQVANLEAQIARDQAELAGKPLTFAASTDPDLLKYQHLQQDYYDQHVAQYRAQINSYDAKVKQYQATIKKLEGDQRSYSERGDIATKVEAMRVELEKKGAGSLLNLLPVAGYPGRARAPDRKYAQQPEPRRSKVLNRPSRMPKHSNSSGLASSARSWSRPAEILIRPRPSTIRPSSIKTWYVSPRLKTRWC